MNLEDQIAELIKNGPSFSQSKFQTHSFIVKKHNSGPREYRQLLLELNGKYNALKLAQIETRKTNAKLSILAKSIEKETDKDRKTILECNYDKLMLSLSNQDKLVLDAIDECNYLYSEIEKMPKYTNEEFEKAEEEYWKNRLLLDAELSIMSTGRIDIGTAQSLVAIGIDPLNAQVLIGTAQNNKVAGLLESK